jgi:hypothetical protein
MGVCWWWIGWGEINWFWKFKVSKRLRKVTTAYTVSLKVLHGERSAKDKAYDSDESART